MSDPLPLTLMVVLIALCLSLVATLLQIRRTARKFEAFLEAAQMDLASITADVRSLRLRVEPLLAPLQAGAQELAGFARALGELGQGLRAAQHRLRTGLTLAGSYVNGLAKGLAALWPRLKP